MRTDIVEMVTRRAALDDLEDVADADSDTSDTDGDGDEEDVHDTIQYSTLDTVCEYGTVLYVLRGCSILSCLVRR